MTKGFIAEVGYNIKSACVFNYFLNEQKAKDWIEKELKLFLSLNPKAEGKIEIAELQKCKMPSCNDLVEKNFGSYCLKCEDILADVQYERLERIKEFDDFGERGISGVLR